MCIRSTLLLCIRSKLLLSTCLFRDDEAWWRLPMIEPTLTLVSEYFVQLTVVRFLFSFPARRYGLPETCTVSRLRRKSKSRPCTLTFLASAW